MSSNLSSYHNSDIGGFALCEPNSTTLICLCVCHIQQVLQQAIQHLGKSG